MVGHLRVGDVENFHIAVPPYQEQIEIVNRMISLQKLCKDSIDITTSNLRNIELLYHNFLIKNLGETPIIPRRKTLISKSKTSNKTKRRIKFNPIHYL